MFFSRKAQLKPYMVSHKRNKRSARFLTKPTLLCKKIGTTWVSTTNGKEHL